MKFELPLVDAVTEESITTIKRSITRKFDYKYVLASSSIQSLLAYTPLAFGRKIWNDIMENVDIIISNIPAMTTHIYHAGAKCHWITAFAPPLANSPMNIFVHTYAGQSRIQMVTDANC